MGYLPPGADVRHLHHLESRFAPLARRLIAAYPGQRVPLSPCQEAVARWFGHPHWHAAVTRLTRGADRQPMTWSSRGADETPVRPAPSEVAWLTDVPIKTLKSLADALQKQLNLYRDHDRGPSMYWTDAKTFDLMARVAGFKTGLEMNQAWAAHLPDAKHRTSWWVRVRDVLRPTPPEGDWTWAKTREELQGSFCRPSPGGIEPPEPMVRTMGQDLDSGWWMGMTSRQARAHTLLLGALGTGRDTVLAGWITDAIRQGQSVAWFTAHDSERSARVERLFNEQAKLCLRDQDRVTLDLTRLTNDEAVPASRSVRVNLFDGFSAGGITEIMVNAMGDDEDVGQMWKGRAVGLVAAVLQALVWERDQQGVPLTLARLRAALDLEVLRQRAHNEDLPQNVRTILDAYLRTLPLYTTIDHLPEVTREQHGFLSQQIVQVIDAWTPFEERLFSNDPGRARWHDLCLPAPARPSGGPSARLLLVLCGDRCPPVVQALLLGAMRTSLAIRLGESIDVVPAPRLASPAMLVFDNVAMNRLPGMLALPSQARAMNIGMVHAMDDLDTLSRACSGPNQGALLANCATRVLMRQANVTHLREQWARITIDGQRDLPHDESLAPCTAEIPDPEVLLHYAIGEALVLHKGKAWHMGMVADLLRPDV